MISHIKKYYYISFLATPQENSSRLSMKIVKNLSRFRFDFSWIAVLSLVLLKQTPVIHALEDLKTFSSNIGIEQEPPLLLEKLQETHNDFDFDFDTRAHESSSYLTLLNETETNLTEKVTNLINGAKDAIQRVKNVYKDLPDWKNPKQILNFAKSICDNMPIFTKEFSIIGNVFGFLADYAPGRSSNETPGTPHVPPSSNSPPELDPELSPMIEDLDARFQEIEDQMKELLVDIKIHLCKTDWDEDIENHITVPQATLEQMSSEFF